MTVSGPAVPNSPELIERTFTVMDVAVMLVDPATRVILAGNPAIEQVFGYRLDELIGQTTEVLHLSRETFLAFGERARQALATRTAFHGEFQMRRRDGRLIFTENSVFSIYDQNGRRTATISVIRDISDARRVAEAVQGSRQQLEAALVEVSQREQTIRHQAEELRLLNAELTEAHVALKSTQAQVIQQERLRALGQMASGIAHDLNNALAPVIGYSELLLTAESQLDQPSDPHHYLRLINTGAQDAASMVRRLREFYRQRGADERLVPVNVSIVVDEVVALTRPRWKDDAQASGVTIVVETDLRPVPLITGNAAELREALTNLVFNAVDAMPRGGTITLRTRGQGDDVLVQVIDTGEGMTEEVRQRCLEPFYSTKGSRGTGLGLSMVHGIAQRHDGRIVIESAPDRGTTISLFLAARPRSARQDTPSTPSPALSPAVDQGEAVRRMTSTPGGFWTMAGATQVTDAPGRPAADRPQDRDNQRGQDDQHDQTTAGDGPHPSIVGPATARLMRVLVVDDEPVVRQLTATFLAMDGHTVTTSGSGAAALDLVQQGQRSQTPFDLVITDMAMPGMTGQQLAASIKATWPEIGVLLLTGYGDLLNAAGDLPSGVDLVLGKPVSMGRLRQAVAKMASGSRQPR